MSARQRGDDQEAWGPAIDRRALALWPRLDPKALRRCRHDPRCIAALVSRRTSLSVDTIVGMLTRPDISPEERDHWFG